MVKIDCLAARARPGPARPVCNTLNSRTQYCALCSTVEVWNRLQYCSTWELPNLLPPNSKWYQKLTRRQRHELFLLQYLLQSFLLHTFDSRDAIDGNGVQRERVEQSRAEQNAAENRAEKSSSRAFHWLYCTALYSALLFSFSWLFRYHWILINSIVQFNTMCRMNTLYCALLNRLAALWTGVFARR